MRGPTGRGERHAKRYRQRERDDIDDGFTWPRTTAVDIENMARDAFTRVNDIHDDAVHNDEHAPMDANVVEGDKRWNEERLDNVVRESTENVFEGSTLNRLQCSIVLFSLCSFYSMPHTFLDALLTWIAGDLLPTSNCFPRMSYEVKNMLMKLGLKHKQNHCC